MFDLAILPELECNPTAECRVSEVISALAYALDLAEGQPAGHAVRACRIGMRIAEVLRLDDADRSALYYGLLLKDLGGSAIAAKMCYLFGADDRQVKRDLTSVDWAKMSDRLQFMGRSVMPDGSPLQRAVRGAVFALEGPAGPSRLIRARSDRGARIVRRLGFAEATATAIEQLDEHWDGHGQSEGLKGNAISPLARISSLAQTIDVFFCSGGPAAAIGIAGERSGTWFDPALVDAFLSFSGDDDFWRRFDDGDTRAEVVALEPPGRVLSANDATLDRIARAFARVVDAKSPWTYGHSEGVARIAVGMANVLGLPQDAVTRVYRAALLHDIGKLGVSNLILDKPGNLTSEEYVELRRHPEWTHQILGRTSAFNDITEMAATHHERLDGRGYYRGLRAGELPIESRLLVVADISEALAAKRPYRAALPREKVEEMLTRDAGTAVCPECVDAMKVYHGRTDAITRVNDQLNQLERLMQSL